MSPACTGSNATGLKGNKVCQGYARKRFFSALGPVMVDECDGDGVHQHLDHFSPLVAIRCPPGQESNAHTLPHHWLGALSDKLKKCIGNIYAEKSRSRLRCQHNIHVYISYIYIYIYIDVYTMFRYSSPTSVVAKVLQHPVAREVGPKLLHLEANKNAAIIHRYT